MAAQNAHWLVRPTTIRLLWRGSGVVLAGLVLSDLFIAREPHFGIDGLPGFSAAFGFLACVGLVLGAKGLGMLLKKPDDYYDE